MGLVGSKCAGAQCGGGGADKTASPAGWSPNALAATPVRESHAESSASTCTTSPERASSIGGSFDEGRVGSAPAPRFLTRGDDCAGSLRELLRAHVAAQVRSLGTSSPDAPNGCAPNLWIDIHIVDFVNDAHRVWSASAASCSRKCQDARMRAGQRVYDWSGVRVTARAYAEATFADARAAVEDEARFPPEGGGEYAATFFDEARLIATRLLRLWAHVYHAHFSVFLEKRTHARVNAAFKAFLIFVLKHDLIDVREIEPIAELVRNMLRPPPPPPFKTPPRAPLPPAAWSPERPHSMPARPSLFTSLSSSDFVNGGVKPPSSRKSEPGPGPRRLGRQRSSLA
jgi:hypothetical protein